MAKHHPQNHVVLVVQRYLKLLQKCTKNLQTLPSCWLVNFSPFVSSIIPSCYSRDSVPCTSHIILELLKQKTDNSGPMKIKFGYLFIMISFRTLLKYKTLICSWINFTKMYKYIILIILNKLHGNNTLHLLSLQILLTESSITMICRLGC